MAKNGLCRVYSRKSDDGGVPTDGQLGKTEANFNRVSLGPICFWGSVQKVNPWPCG